MKFSHVLRILVFGLILFGCGPEPISHGKIISKNYYPSYTSHSIIIIGKMIVPTSYYHPEYYEIVIHGINKDNISVDTNIIITKQKYDSVNIDENY